MQVMKPLLLSFSLLAFAGAAAAGGGKDASSGTSSEASTGASSGASTGASGAQQKSFSELDNDNDGMLSMTEAAADANAKSKFEKLDENNDYKLSREEYQGASGASAGAGGQGGKQDVPAWEKKSRSTYDERTRDKGAGR